MNITNRLERLEGRAGLRDCPCRAPRQIEIGEADAEEMPTCLGGCELCGAPLPISRIMAVRPPGLMPAFCT